MNNKPLTPTQAKQQQAEKDLIERVNKLTAKSNRRKIEARRERIELGLIGGEIA
jgi:hypothetical protein